MDPDQLLDRLLVPRPTGSDGFLEVGSLIETTLRQHTPHVERHVFLATPHGFQLLFGVAFLLALGFVLAIMRRHYRFALALIAGTALLLFVEAELLWSPVSGLLAVEASNIVGIFPGAEQGPTVILSAHYDTATQFGDHFAWNRWGPAMGPAALAAAALALIGLRRQRRRGALSLRLTVPVSLGALLPFAAMAWFFTVGPLLRAPSPGALDNGGSVAVLLQMAERLAARPPDSPTTVRLVFFAAEEERALGSWRYAATLDPEAPTVVINLETLGTGEPIGFVPEEGFQLQRYRPSQALVEEVDEVARQISGHALVPVAVPRAAVSDARSFLARGIPALTLMGPSRGALPRQLHSEHDARERLSLPALDRAVDLLEAVVARVDREPSVLLRRETGPQRAGADEEAP